MDQSSTKRAGFKKSRKGGGSKTMAEVATISSTDLQAYTVLVEGDKLSSYLQQEKQDDLTDPATDPAEDDRFGAFARLESETREVKQMGDSIVHGKMYSVYTDYMRNCVKQAVVVKDNGTHNCNHECSLVELKGMVHRVPGHPSRVHVCVSNVPCGAPPAMHAHVVKRVERTVFVCTGSNKVHVCTSEKCDARRVHTTNYICCELTGNVLADNQNVLSHGWVEDDWRTAVSSNHTVRRPHICKPVAIKLPQKSRKRKKRRRTETAVDRKIQATTASLFVEWWQLLMTPDHTEIQTDRIAELEERLCDYAKCRILELLPGSSTRETLEAAHKQRSVLRFIFSVDKYIKRTVSNKQQISLNNLQSMHRQISDWGCNNQCEAAMCLSREKAAIISLAYARNAVAYLRMLLGHTDFVQSDVCFEDYVCAVLYLQRTNFRVRSVSIFSPDEFLSVLPYASNLDAYGYTKNTFTAAKTAVQDVVIEAIDTHGKDAGTFVYPVCSFFDLFV